MLALLSRAPGPPESLALCEVPDPVPGPGEILVRVKACGVNFPDVLIIEDRYQVRPERPFAPGCEVAGVVEALGPGVTGPEVGERVIGYSTFGGMAEKLVIGAERLVAMPDSMTFDEGAALTMTYGAAHYALHDRGDIRAGETLLVLGAAGGMGLAAVELGKAAGARVVAAVSSAEKAQAAREAGADEAVIYPRGPFDREGAKALAAEFKRACGPEGAQVVFDPVGGDYAEAAIRAIAWAGRFLVVGFPAGIPKLPLNLVLLKSCHVVGVAWRAVIRRDPEGEALRVRELIELFDRRRISVRISERFPLARGGEAIARLADRRAIGKIVVTVDGPQITNNPTRLPVGQ